MQLLRDKLLVCSLIGFVAVQVLVGIRVHNARATRAVSEEPAYHALDVGQGDATLLSFENGVKILIDAGPDQKVLQSIQPFMGEQGYIDVGIITHPQKDHFYGFLPLLRRYRFGIVLWNGRVDASDAKNWDALRQELVRQNIPLLSVGEGDRLRTTGSELAVVSPGQDYLESGELNDTSLVAHVRTSRWSALLTGDIDTVVEQALLRRYGDSLSVDILKVPHHGSKYSSGEAFVAAVAPIVATVSVGGRNTYGHPAPEILARYAKAGARVLRTDEQGSVTLRGSPEGLVVAIASSSPP